jgi:hypothetical protein
VPPTQEKALVAYWAARLGMHPDQVWAMYRKLQHPLLDICDPVVQRELWEATGGEGVWQ